MKLKLGFSHLSPTLLCAFALALYTAMTTLPGSGMFSALLAAVNQMKATADFLLTAISEGNGPGMKQVRSQLVAELVKKMKLLGMDVERIADGDEAMLAASGFHLKQKPVKRTEPMSAPINVRIDPYKLTGWLKGGCKAEKGARGYIGRYRVPGGEWVVTETFPNSRSIIFGGLIRGTEIEFQLCVTGPTRTSNWSDTATTMVL